MKQLKRMNPRKLKVRTWLIIGLTSFVLIGLVLLLAFQTFFLDDLYKLGKIQTVKNATRELCEVYGTQEFADSADYWNIREDCGVYLIDSQGKIISSRGVFETADHNFSVGVLRAYYDEATASSDGTVFSMDEINLSVRDNKPKDKPSYEFHEPPSAPPEKRYSSGSEKMERVMYAKLVSQEEAEPLLLLTVSLLTPVEATVNVLQVQLGIAMVVFVLTAVLLAGFMGESVAAPIVRINTAAKGLASGTYRSPREGSYREIAELRDTLTEIDAELRKSEQLQRDLIANVSHDMRTPLTMIIGYGEAIRDLPGEDSAENIQVVIDEAERLSHLVNDVLDLSKIQSGVEQLEMVPIKLTEVLQDVVLRIGRMTRQDGYVVELVADEEVTVTADEVRLSQIIYNLLTNALAHTGEDKTVIVRQTVKEKSVRVSFTDSGNGIPPQELSNIWLRYYQVHGHERRHAMNSGLGLSIVRALVELHGGVCGVDSTLGEGSTFWFELPIV